MFLTLPYPVSANRYWRSCVRQGRAVVLVSKEAQEYRNAVGWIAAANMVKVTGYPVSVGIILKPKTTKTGEASMVLMDLDNAIKITLDALTGIAFIDDKQVRKISAEYGEAVKDGGLVVTVNPL